LPEDSQELDSLCGSRIGIVASFVCSCCKKTSGRGRVQDGTTFTKETAHIYENATFLGGGGKEAEKAPNEWGPEEQNRKVSTTVLVEARAPPLASTHQS